MTGHVVIRGAAAVVTMDDSGGEIADGDVRLRGGTIAEVGRGLAAGGADVIDARGMRADIAVWDLSGVEAADAWDPVAALLLCGPHRVRDLFVEGRRVVAPGHIATIALPRVLEEQRRPARRLAEG